MPTPPKDPVRAAEAYRFTVMKKHPLNQKHKGARNKVHWAAFEDESRETLLTLCGLRFGRTELWRPLRPVEVTCGHCNRVAEGKSRTWGRPRAGERLR